MNTCDTPHDISLTMLSIILIIVPSIVTDGVRGDTCVTEYHQNAVAEEVRHAMFATNHLHYFFLPFLLLKTSTY